MTDEDREEERLAGIRLDRVKRAREAIVAHAGPWQKDKGVMGQTDCPICIGMKSLRFYRSGVNGHIYARCQTMGCVSWME